MTPSDETSSSAIQSPYESSARLRVGTIGEVTGVGQCWRLAYDRCDHVQQFAQEGLEDPTRLVLFVQRNFPECLTCRLVPQRVSGYLPASESTFAG